MTMIYSSWLPLILLFIFIFSYLIYRQEKAFFAWIKLYWFYTRSRSSVMSSFFYILSFVLFSVALLDIRGPEVRLNMDIPDQKTILLIDSSSSMLVEDVRPNRFKRGLFLARHFVRSAVGHQISIVLFSDTSKRVVSFTSDVDLLDARLTGIEKMSIDSGGSNISGAVHEAIGYFQDGSNSSDVSGNIVLITDGEENESGIEKALPAGVSLAVIGLGTAQGGLIPMRSEDGSFRGYRRYNNENITSKLDERWLQNFGGGHASYKYWIAQSYSVPTQEILEFFAQAYNKRIAKSEVRYRPVWGFPLIALGLLCLGLSSLVSLKKTFIKSLLVIFCFVGSNDHMVYAQEPVVQEEPVMSEETNLLFKKLKDGELTGSSKHTLAQMLYVDGFKNESLALYEEIFEKQSKTGFRESWKNYAFLLLLNKQFEMAGSELLQLFETSESQEEAAQLRTNVILILAQMSEGSSEGPEEEQEQESKDEQNSGQSDDQNKQQNKKDKDASQSENQKQTGDPNESQGATDQSEQGTDEPENSDKKEQGDEGKKDEPEDGQNDMPEEEKPKDWESKVEEMKDELRTKEKMPAILKQIIDADREVQQEQLDTRTNKPSSGEKKDW